MRGNQSITAFSDEQLREWADTGDDESVGVVFNNDLDLTVRELARAVLAEREKVASFIRHHQRISRIADQRDAAMAAHEVTAQQYHAALALISDLQARLVALEGARA